MITCLTCGFQIALNLMMTWDEQTAVCCPRCLAQGEWFTSSISKEDFEAYRTSEKTKR